MKKIVVFLLITALSSVLHAQNNKCSTPIANQQFLQKYNQIKNKQTDASKLQLAKKIINSSCFSSNQVQELASLFQNDYDRLEFAKNAYKNTTDKENFYDVYDAFIYYSVVFRLHDYIKSGTNNQTNEKTYEISFPHYNYPNHKGYRGHLNCFNPINYKDFKSIAINIDKQHVEREKYDESLDYIRNACFPTEYLMKIGSLINSEALKLEFAKKGFESVYDINNYTEMKQIFGTPKARSEFVDFLSSQKINNERNDEVRDGRNASSSGSVQCKVSDNDYQQILRTVRNEKFNTNKLSTAKHLIQSNKKCFNAKQIKGIIDLFDYENSRLEIAKYGYKFVSDQSNYYVTVSNALAFESNRQRLLDFIQKNTR